MAYSNFTLFWVSFQAWFPKKREGTMDEYGDPSTGVKCKNGMKTENS